MDELKEKQEKGPEMLRETNFPWLGKKRTGKVRDVYEQENRLIIVATDRHSSFDRIIAHIPYKGEVLTGISNWWFEQTKDIVPNHIIATPDPRVIVARKCNVIPVEAVFRGYITGTTGTSLWTQYKDGKRDFGDFTLPEGMTKNQKLEGIAFTPTTKSEVHDETLSPAEMLARGIVDAKTLSEIERIGRALFERGQKLALERGLILVDTKYEFGIDENGQIVLIDEIHTPDSSRYWQAASYMQRIAQGLEPEYFDKEFLRLWFKEHCDPYKDAVLPDAPPELVEELSRRYIRMYEQITGEAFKLGQEPIASRIEQNLRPYAV